MKGSITNEQIQERTQQAWLQNGERLSLPALWWNWSHSSKLRICNSLYLSPLYGNVLWVWQTNEWNAVLIKTNIERKYYKWEHSKQKQWQHRQLITRLGLSYLWTHSRTVFYLIEFSNNTLNELKADAAKRDFDRDLYYRLYDRFAARYPENHMTVPVRNYRTPGEDIPESLEDLAKQPTWAEKQAQVRHNIEQEHFMSMMYNAFIKVNWVTHTILGSWNWISSPDYFSIPKYIKRTAILMSRQITRKRSVALFFPQSLTLNHNSKFILIIQLTCTIARVRSCALLLFLRFLCNMHKKFSLTTYLHFLGGRRVYKQLSNSHISI